MAGSAPSITRSGSISRVLGGLDEPAPGAVFSAIGSVYIRARMTGMRRRDCTSGETTRKNRATARPPDLHELVNRGCYFIRPSAFSVSTTLGREPTRCMYAATFGYAFRSIFTKLVQFTMV